jgi:1,5-anhydro-D-fructose reductase (1,5-anhydro-D-mannitol-forming)
VSATYASFTQRQVEDQAVVSLGYPGGAIGVIESGFLSLDPFSIEMHGTTASLAYDSTGNGLRSETSDQTAGRRCQFLMTRLTHSAVG